MAEHPIGRVLPVPPPVSKPAPVNTAPSGSSGFLGGASSGGNTGASNNIATNPITSTKGAGMAGQTVTLPNGSSYVMQGASSGTTVTHTNQSGGSGGSGTITMANDTGSGNTNTSSSSGTSNTTTPGVGNTPANTSSPVDQANPKMAQTLPADNQSTGQPERVQDLISNPAQQDAFYQSLGTQADSVAKSIGDFETQTGRKVSTDSLAFQNQFNQVKEKPNEWGNVFARFGHLQENVAPSYSTSVAPVESSAMNDNALLKKPVVTPTQTSQDQINSVLKNNGTQSVYSQMAQLMALPADTPGETLLRNSLMLQLGAIDDPSVNQYLDNMESRALQKYSEGMALVKKGTGEIDNAISGTMPVDDPTTPQDESVMTTSEGLLAKIYKQQETQSLAATQNQTEYDNAKYDVEMKDLQNKRADLVGYTKAKLYSMGAEDSSAGVALLGKIVSEADMQITLKQIDHTYNQKQLAIQSQNTILDFTNNVAKLVMDNKSQQATVAATYSDTIDKIDGQRLTNEGEKRKQTLEAFGTYTKDIIALQEQQKTDERAALKDAFDKQMAINDYALKASGTYGTVFVPDKNGNLYDTGVPTFEAKKYTNTFMLDTMRMNLDISQEKRQQASELISNYGSQASPWVEQLLGLPSGALSGFQTKDELNRAVDIIKENNALKKSAQQNGFDYDNGEALDKYLNAGGGIKKGGIGINPISLPDVRDTISKLASVTQSFSTTVGTDTGGGHGGIDYVSKDGYSRAVRGGTVVGLVPWDGNSAWGNQVLVKDDNGVTWQYSHMGDRSVAGDVPFSVQMGERIDAGDVLGREGNTGRVISKSTGKLAGRHTDLRIVGAEATSTKSVTQTQTKMTAAEQKAYDDKNKIISTDSIGANWPIMGDYLKDWFTQNYTYDDLAGIYMNQMKTAPSGGDEEMLRKKGMEGLDLILQREAAKKKTLTIQ